LTYEPEEVQEIMEYARERGIRVILEFDTPGHTQGFGKSHPEILTPCFGEEGVPGTPNYPNHTSYEILDPTRNVTYDFMKEFFTEVKEVSKDDHVHLGMDEVSRKIIIQK
jgi:hexosaminidase